MFEGCLCPAQHETLQARKVTQETLEEEMPGTLELKMLCRALSAGKIATFF